MEQDDRLVDGVSPNISCTVGLYSFVWMDSVDKTNISDAFTLGVGWMDFNF